MIKQILAQSSPTIIIQAKITNSWICRMFNCALHLYSTQYRVCLFSGTLSKVTKCKKL